MKFRSNITLICATALIGVFSALSCTNIDDFEKRLESLESKVEALEKLIPGLNNNIDALKELAGGSMINKVDFDETTEAYTLTLTNGNTIVLNQGSIGVANPPVMSINEDGYWMADYGKGAQLVLGKDQLPVKATGNDGITPMIGINSEGQWTISLDKGQNYEIIKDADGSPISAVPEEDAAKYFDDITVNDSKLIITLKNDGGKIEVPIIPDFLLQIGELENAEKGENGVYSLTAGNNYRAQITSKGISVISVLTKPAGVEANVDTETNSLIVRAIGTTSRAVADSRTDLALLAIGKNGLSTIAKIQVKVEGTYTPEEDGKPAAYITAMKDKATTGSLTFTVTLDNAASYKFKLLKSSEVAPSTPEDFNIAEATDLKQLEFTGLEHSCAYTLYVLPMQDDTFGNITKANCSTLVPNKPKVEFKGYEADFTMLKFSLEMTDVTDYWYLVAPASEDVTEEMVMNEGKNIIIIEESQLNALIAIEDLQPSTSYKLHLLPLNSTIAGDLYSTEAAATKAIDTNNLYEVFSTGGKIEIAGKEYSNKDLNDVKIYRITKDSDSKEISDNGVYFIDSDATDVKINKVNGFGTLWVICNDKGKKASVTLEKSIRFGTNSNIFFKNISIAQFTDNVLIHNTANGTCTRLAFDACKIVMPVNGTSAKSLVYNDDTRSVGDLSIHNCDIEITADNQSIVTARENYTKVDLFNNIFYSESDRNTFKLIRNDDSTKPAELATLSVVDNTFINVYPEKKNNYGYIYVKSVGAFTYKNNLYELGKFKDNAGTYRNFLCCTESYPQTQEFVTGYLYLNMEGIAESDINKYCLKATGSTAKDTPDKNPGTTYGQGSSAFSNFDYTTPAFTKTSARQNNGATR